MVYSVPAEANALAFLEASDSKSWDFNKEKSGAGGSSFLKSTAHRGAQILGSRGSMDPC
jgi:hypothetical protein